MNASTQSFDKFGWLKALRMDHRFTDREVRLALAICTDYARRDGTGWAVELDVLAASVPRGISRNRLKDTLQKLTECGYLVETARTVGGRGVTARRAHDLSKPAPAAVQVKDETRHASGASIAKTRTASGSNPHRQRFKPAPPAVQKTGSELPEQPPIGTSTGTSYGGARLSDEPIDAEPSRYCPDHPAGTSDDCIPCMHHRKRRDQWQCDQTAREQRRHAAIVNARKQCATCHGTGQVDIRNNTVARCPDCSTPEAKQRVIDSLARTS